MSKKKYPQRVPSYVAGIRLQEIRSAPRREWWAVRFLESVAAKDVGGRFGRGRAYAMSGQVESVEIQGNTVTCRVMGARKRPYVSTLVFRKPKGEARERIMKRLREEPVIVARLAAGDMPRELEAIFRMEGLDLFPGGKLGYGVYDVTTSCTCPDYANPCKHSIAALLILGAEIVQRPALLLELRGIPLKEVIDG